MLHLDRRIDCRPGRLEHREEFVGPRLDLVAAARRDTRPQDGPQLLDQGCEMLVDALHQRGGTLDIGHQHRDESAGEHRDTCVERRQGPFHFQLSGNEADRHDLELLRRVQQTLASAVTGCVALEVDPPEPCQRVANMARIVDRQSPAATRVDVREGTVGKFRPLVRIEACHVQTVARSSYRSRQPAWRQALTNQGSVRSMYLSTVISSDHSANLEATSSGISPCSPRRAAASVVK